MSALILAAAIAQPIALPPPAPWNPTLPYVIVGQDEPGYRSWYLAAAWRATWVKSFNEYLASQGVGGVVPTWQLLRTASDWYKCGDNAFELPPSSEWPKLAASLRFVRDQVIPTVGPVEAVSVYRNPALNTCAGGAQESAHRYGQALDLVPLNPTTRDELMRKLCIVHRQRGDAYATGLGFYVGLRFHVDSRKFRRWGVDPAVERECPPLPQPPAPPQPTGAERGVRR